MGGAFDLIWRPSDEDRFHSVLRQRDCESGGLQRFRQELTRRPVIFDDEGCCSWPCFLCRWRCAVVRGRMLARRSARRKRCISRVNTLYTTSD